MYRRPRIDLGQKVNKKEESRLERKRERWAARNKHRPASENPFLMAIKPDNPIYGEPDENKLELKARLANLEFGNFPGYFNYRKKAAEQGNSSATNHESADSNKPGKDETDNPNEQIGSYLESGLSDERLTSMKAEWFSDKDVLDIGCNRGHITYAIAKLFRPKFIMGIDIDMKIVRTANRDLSIHLNDDSLKGNQLLRRRYAESLRITISDGAVEVRDECKTSVEPSSKDFDQPNAGTTQESELSGSNILFIEHNYVLARDDLVDKQKAHFDTILCLSVTKWIHLNYGDEGLKRFFRRVYKHLRPNGLFVLEAQPFDNYGRRKRLSERLRANYHSIQFKPDQFDDYLVSEEIGFRQLVHSSTTDHKCSGFKRPLKVFLK